MKPTIRSTAIALALLGAAAFVLLPFGTVILVPSVAAAAGLFLRLRYAWWLGLATAVVDLGIVVVLAAIALLFHGGKWSWAAMAIPVAHAAFDGYVLTSLAVIRAHFRAKK